MGNVDSIQSDVEFLRIQRARKCFAVSVAIRKSLPSVKHKQFGAKWFASSIMFSTRLLRKKTNEKETVWISDSFNSCAS